MIKVALKPQEPRMYAGGEPWYDSVQGIANAIKSLGGFHELVEERHTAAYKRNELLNVFYVFGGRWSLDSCGNTGKATHDPLPERYRVLIPVATRDKFCEYRNQKQREAPDEIDEFLSHALNGGQLPHTQIPCAHCGAHWTIENCFDVVVKYDSHIFPLTAFVGRTIAEVKQSFALRTEALYQMDSNSTLRNDRFIDLRPKYPNSTVSWEQGVVTNERGWVSAKDGITEDTPVCVGDEGLFSVWTYMHVGCGRARIRKDGMEMFTKIFTDAGFSDITLSETKNEYGSEDRRGPWWNVHTPFGTIRVGWRKRVIEIEWSALHTAPQLHILPIHSLFDDVTDTKTHTLIHAYNYGTATEYLTRIYKHLSGQK